MSFNAGSINAGGFLATGRFVSHVTGFATLFGVDLMSQRFDAALGILSVPIFFLLGAFLAGLLIDRPLHQKRVPHFDYVMGLSSICLFLAALQSDHSQFEKLEAMIHLKQVYVLLALLCLSCGLQNGAMTSSSGSSVRTTHLTGLTTDLGLGIAKILSLSKQDGAYLKEFRANELRAGSIVSFVLGSAIGAGVFMKLGFRGFILPGTIALYAAWHGRQEKIAAHRIATLE
jgi:uncharacterized membrane protein YoaK (UPF0700 family)